MKANYDFSEAKRGSVIPAKSNKVRITIRIDRDIVAWFKKTVEEKGTGNYQSMLNDALRKHIKQKDQPLEKLLRKVVRDELRKAS